MLELFSGLPPGHSAFERFSFIDADDLPELQAVLDRAAQDGVDGLDAEDRGRLLSLPFLLQPARHRLGVVDDDLRGRLLAARRRFAASLPESLRDRIQFFDAERYNAAASIQDNILFGKVAYGQARASERVKGLVTEVIDELGLRSAVIEVGLDFPVGIGGGRLGTVQRQKVGLARALLKRPDVLVLSDATAGLDGGTHERIAERVFRSSREGGSSGRSTGRSSPAVSTGWWSCNRAGWRSPEPSRSSTVKGARSASCWRPADGRDGGRARRRGGTRPPPRRRVTVRHARPGEGREGRRHEPERRG